MHLVNPLALFWLAALVPVVIFYVLKVRLRRVPVSTLLFWRQVFDEHKPRSLWQRLRYWVSLLAQIVLILLLVFALTDPVFTWQTRESRRIVLVLDNSASMSAADVVPSRLAAAKMEAARVISAMREQDVLAVVTAGGTPQVACGFSSHRGTLKSSVNAVAATDNPTRVAEAVELARRLLGDSGVAQLCETIVLTDVGHVSNVPAGDGHVGNVPHDSRAIVFRRFGTNAGNVGITMFQVRRSVTDPLGYEILIEVTNASDEPVECRLDIDLNDDVVDVVPLNLAAGQRWGQTIEKTSADGGILNATIDRADVLAADNQAWAVLPKREPIPVTLVTAGNLFIQKVFESHPLVELTRVAPAMWQASDARQITVLHQHVPQQLPNGPVLMIDPRGDCDLWKVGELLSNPIVSQQDKESPLMQHVRLDNVVMPEARQVTFAGDEGVKVLARSVSGDPLLATVERRGRKVLVLMVNLDEGDLPLRTAFPILMMNALNWFTENRGELRESLPTGAMVVDRTAIKQSDRGTMGNHSLVAPDGRRTPLALSADQFSLGPLEQCGVWRVVTAGATGDTPLLELACNLADRNESDVRVPTSDEATPTFAFTASLVRDRPVWFWLAGFSWLLLAVEWWAYQRRVIA